jgi:hypothetical protein
MVSEYMYAAIIAALVIALIIYLIRRNRKDQKILEKEMNLSELKPEEHKDDSV